MKLKYFMPRLVSFRTMDFCATGSGADSDCNTGYGIYGRSCCNGGSNKELCNSGGSV